MTRKRLFDFGLWTLDLGLLLLLSGCGGKAAPEAQKTAPAKVENAKKESDLTTVTLTPQAEARLGIATTKVETRTVARTSTFAGEVMVAPGHAIIVAAPVAGTLAAAGRGAEPSPGARVRRGEPLFRLQPLVAAERDLLGRAETDVAVAQAQFDAAQLKARRAAQLLRDQAGSVRAHEEARSELAVAEARLKSARSQLERVSKNPLQSDVSLTIAAPENATVLEVHAAAGQTVAAGAPLAKLADLRSLWVRVPIYAGDLKNLDHRQAARIHGLGESPGAGSHFGKPVTGPPSADPKADTVDFFYQLSDAAGFQPGQKVGVTLSLRGAEPSLVVPSSAILYDVHGGAWVYVSGAPHTFVRRRVELRRVAGPLAVLDRGPALGTKVVSTGAAELFGTEFGAK